MAPVIARGRKPIESPPHIHGLYMTRDGWNKHAGTAYKPGDRPDQEDWGSVANKFGVDVKQLIFFNFLTDEPDIVNWYLHHYVGCVKHSPSGFNFMFSSDARPGIIYIPSEKIDFDGDTVCVWAPHASDKFLKQLVAIAQSVPGYRGERLKALTQVALKAGYPACLDLWYYNEMCIRVYVDLLTGNAKRREMTKDTGGAFPFDGDSGLYGQQGTEEQHRGKWRIHPFRWLFDEFKCASLDADRLRDRLVAIDEDMYRGWHEMDLVSARSSQGGGSAWGEMVWDFIAHVGKLSHDKTHLYSAFDQ